MAGKFEAPRGQKGNIPKRTDAKPGQDGMPPLRPEQPQRPKKSSPPASSRKRRKRLPILPILAVILAVAIVIALVVGGIQLAKKLKNPPAPTEPPVTTELTTTPTETEPPVPETTLPEPEHVVTTASVGTIGDLLMHKGIITGAQGSDGSYDFSYIFRYLTEYVQGVDYAVANLETTFGGTGFPYQGNPSFNCPDILAQNAKDAGFDMFLTANNHCYDTLMTGIRRSLEVSHEAGLQTIGTRASEDDARYEIVEVNGIKIGMVCYTYTMSVAGSGRPSLNGNTPVENPALVNWFFNGKLDVFYAEAESVLQEMKAQGAEAIMFYIHWGEEYQLAENSTQDAIAQKLCDMGVDVIVGGHPHVIEPMALLSSNTDPEHKTVCIYSLGNAVSNQRIAEMRLKTGHTEDGCMFTVTFEKYSDGTVYLASADVLPTWVNLRTEAGKKRYDILPLDNDTRDTWRDTYELNDTLYENAVNSYGRTMALVNGGLKDCNEYLQAQKAAREAYYYELAMGTLPDAA